MSFRASTGNLGLVDEPRRAPAPERWDRDKFERFSRRAADDRERETFHFEEHDRARGRHLDVEIEDRKVEIRAPRPRVEEKERYFEEDRHGPSRRRLDFLDKHDPAEITDRALAPYRRKSIAERDVNIAVRRPTRPNYLRRQSSLDTFDRRPLPKYSDREYEEWRPPTNVPIPLPIRKRAESRLVSPPRTRYREEDYEEIHYRDIDSERDDEYRDVHIRRAKSRRRHKSRVRSKRSSSTSSSESSFEEISPIRRGKRGRTRMPKRLVHKSAIIELGYPFEEEDDFFIVRRALDKEQIDEVIQISETYKKDSVSYRYEDKTVHQVDGLSTASAPPPPPTEIVIPPPPPPEVIYVPAPGSVAAGPHSVRSVSPSHHSHHSHHHHDYLEERVEESSHIGGPLTVLVPERRHRSHRDIEAEIRHLEREKRELRLERDSDRYEYEIVERRDPEKNVVRIDRDRKVKKPPNPKIVAAMMATLM